MRIINDKNDTLMSFIVLIFCSWVILEIAWGLGKQKKDE